jgi:hypothetical protein
VCGSVDVPRLCRVLDSGRVWLSTADLHCSACGLALPTTFRVFVSVVARDWWKGDEDGREVARQATSYRFRRLSGRAGSRAGRLSTGGLLKDPRHNNFAHPI